MSLFALPLAPKQTVRLPAKDRSLRYKVALPLRKRKHSSSESENDERGVTSDDEAEPLAAATNPLSLTPAEIAQYKLAGLDLDKELPNVQDFPHRALPTSVAANGIAKSDSNRQERRRLAEEAIGRSGNEEQDIEHEKATKLGHEGLRLQHLKVLVAMLHRCLQQGDIQRALRAWTLLLRTELKGDVIDIRSSGYWAIGAELLARSETEARHDGTRDSDDESDEDISSVSGLDAVIAQWGTPKGRERAVEYLGKLILEYPPNKHHLGSVTALDFWLAMLSIEIYSIQSAHRESTQDIERRQAEYDIQYQAEVSADDLDPEHDHTVVADREERRNDFMDQMWLERDQVRQDTLTATENLSTRLDELLGNTLYANVVSFLKIRGHLAMYINNLSVPERPTEDDASSLDAGRTILYRQ